MGIGGDSSQGVREILAREEVGGILLRGRETLSRRVERVLTFPSVFCVIC